GGGVGKGDVRASPAIVGAVGGARDPFRGDVDDEQREFTVATCRHDQEVRAVAVPDQRLGAGQRVAVSGGTRGGGDAAMRPSVAFLLVGEGTEGTPGCDRAEVGLLLPMAARS